MHKLERKEKAYDCCRTTTTITSIAVASPVNTCDDRCHSDSDRRSIVDRW